MSFVKSDLIFIAPVGDVAERLERIRELARPILELSVEDVVPGQPLRVTWKFNRFAGTGPSSVSVRFLVDGQQVLERPGVQTSDADLGTPTQVEEIKLSSQFYRWGLRRLDLELRSDDEERGRVLHRHHGFAVQREAVAPSWWEWRPGDHQVEWKQPFTLHADFRNGLRFASITTVSVELCEVRADENPLIDPCEYEPIRTEARNAIVAGTSAPFAFPLLHDWDWLAAVTFIIDGPWDKTFSYAAYFQFTDEYGNVYEGVCSPIAMRTISVSVLKRAAGVAAMTAAADAALTAIAAAAATAGIITAVVGAGLWVAAAALYAVATAAAEQAEDPPQPDENYREPVTVEPLEMPEWPGALEPELKALRELVEPAAEIFARERARTITRARMMGARLFDDEEAFAMHRDSYLRLEQEMSEAAAALRRALPGMQEAVEGSETFDPANLRTWIGTLAGDGLPADARASMIEAGLTEDQATAVASLALSRSVGEAVRANGFFLAPLVENIEKMVRAVEAEREVVLAGEDPCPPPPMPPRPRREDEPTGDPEARPRPRHPCRCC